MERLTYWNEEYGCWSYKCASGDMAKQVAELENILYDENKKPRVTLDRLTELVNADCEGRCEIYPCKIGDEAWYVPLYGGKPFHCPQMGHVQRITRSSRGWRITLREYHEHNKDYALGKIAFVGVDAQAKAREAQAALERSKP